MAHRHVYTHTIHMCLMHVHVAGVHTLAHCLAQKEGSCVVRSDPASRLRTLLLCVFACHKPSVAKGFNMSCGEHRDNVCLTPAGGERLSVPTLSSVPHILCQAFLFIYNIHNTHSWHELENVVLRTNLCI